MSTPLIREHEAAQLLGLSVATLRKWRSTRTVDLPFVRLGRACRYRPEDLEEFIKAGTVGEK